MASEIPNNNANPTPDPLPPGQFDFRSLMKKPATSKPATDGGPTSVGIVNPSNKPIQAKVFGQPKPQQPPAPAPAWKQRLEEKVKEDEQKREQQTTQPNPPTAEIPLDIKYWKDRYELEAERRKAVQQQLSDLTQKTQELRDLFTRALATLDAVENSVEEELERQDQWNERMKLDQKEQERLKEEEWKQWMEGKMSFAHFDTTHFCKRYRKKEKKGKKRKGKRGIIFFSFCYSCCS
jgi:hypothetical protein